MEGDMTKLEDAQLRWIDQKREEHVAYTEHSLSNDAVVLEHFGDRVAQLGREWRQAAPRLLHRDRTELPRHRGNALRRLGRHGRSRRFHHSRGGYGKLEGRKLMPSTEEFISSGNVYKFPGESVGLPLQAGEVAWTSKSLTLGQVIGRVVVLAVLAGFVGILIGVRG
jgi:hypothetical protein